MSFAFLALGAVFVGVALLLLAEYRRAILADPLSVMSMEVLANILRLGGPGYLAMLALIAGIPLLLIGVVLLVVMAWILVQPIAQAVLKTLGLG